MKEQSTERHTWMGMIYRCYNPKQTGYHRWGGRGIKVCDRWLESYENFLADMGRKPRFDYTLHRIDNDGNYEPNNCVWASRDLQANGWNW